MDIERNMILGDCLREARKKAGLTQDKLAKRLGTVQSTISKAETGERTFPLVEIFDYIEALGTGETHVEFIKRVEARLDKAGLLHLCGNDESEDDPPERTRGKQRR